MTNRPQDSSQAQDAYERLLELVRSGDLVPGLRITETDLAARLGISRTPIREALRRLELEGLVVHTPRLGATIRVLDWSEITELYEMRAVLEGTAARIAARAASDVDLSELAAINADMEAAGQDGARVYELNRHFHSALANAARNRFLLQSIEALQKPLMILRPNVMTDAARASEAVAEHAQLIAALRARDADAAEAAMRQHIESAHRLRLKQLRDAGFDS
ncbi:MAG: GntR family transcriptional regulator [Rhodobacteraceae bacterium]|nr:GntR family transcriptional regulator [Paracoccaceae bacterium]